MQIPVWTSEVAGVAAAVFGDPAVPRQRKRRKKGKREEEEGNGDKEEKEEKGEKEERKECSLRHLAASLRKRHAVRDRHGRSLEL